MITILEGQSLPDIAIQESGSIEAVFDLAVKNGISITDKLQAGLNINNVNPLNQGIVAYYRAKNIRPATWMAQNQIHTGIGYMGIDVNFIIS
jgi:hypothetical protein